MRFVTIAGMRSQIERDSNCLNIDRFFIISKITWNCFKSVILIRILIRILKRTICSLMKK